MLENDGCRDMEIGTRRGEGIGEPLRGVRGAMIPSAFCLLLPLRRPGSREKTGASTDFSNDRLVGAVPALAK